MIKFFYFLFFIFSMLLSANECVCFELKGKLGLEIKALIKKYKGTLQNVTIKESNNKKNIENILKDIQKNKIKHDDIEKENKQIKDGKVYYENNCKECHGSKGELESSGTSRALNTLTLEQIKNTIRGYEFDEYDRGMAILMKPYASIVTEDSLEKIYKYLEKIK